MSLLKNLGVAWKLGLGAGAAILMLAALVATVHLNLGRLAAAQEESAQATELRRVSQEVSRLMSVAQVQLRDVLLANAPDRVDAALGAMEEASAQAGMLLAGIEDSAPVALRRPIAEAREAERAWIAGATDIARLRRELVGLRDQRLFPLMGEFDQAFEALSANLDFEMQGDERDEARQRMQTFSAAVNDGRIAVQRFLSTQEEAQARRVRRAGAQARVHFRALSTSLEGRLSAAAGRVSASADDMAAVGVRLVEIEERINAVRRDTTLPNRDRLEAAVRTIVATTTTGSLDAMLNALRAGDRTQAIVAWTGGGIALLLLVSGWLTSRAIVRPLSRVRDAIGRLAAGDAATAVPDQGRRDEIGQIAAAMEALRGTVGQAFAQRQMIEQLPSGVMTADPHDDFRITYINPALREMLGRLDAQALPCPVEALVGQSIDIFHARPEHQRALLADPSRLPHRARITLGGEVMDLAVSAITDAAGGYVGPMVVWQLATRQARLADSFEADVGGVVEAVATAAGQLQASARTVAGAAATSGQEAAAVEAESARAGTEVQAVAASAEELAASVAEITRQVTEGAMVARAAAEEARRTDSTVQGLAQAASRIGDVVRLIGDIAGQTNLLALNATIEAARAGEAGRGFAVVAGEVKSLAGQTAKATEEIGAQIAAIQAATGEAVAALRSIGSTVDKLNDVTGAIAAAVEEQSSTTREIARSAAEVAAGTNAAARRIADVRGAAQQTGEAAAGMLDAATELTGRAATLRDRTGEFLAQVRRA